MSREHRRIAALALAAYALMVAVVVLSPDASVASGVVGGAERVLVALGVPDALTAPGRVEFVINAAMFAPLTLLASLVWPRVGWGTWVAAAFVCSGSIELLQALVVEPRSAQHVDVVANTLGGLVGAVAAVLVARQLRSATSH